MCENLYYESVYFKELHNDQAYNREEKSLRHVVMVAKFWDDNKPKIYQKKVNLHCFKLHRSYSPLY